MRAIRLIGDDSLQVMQVGLDAVGYKVASGKGGWNWSFCGDHSHPCVSRSAAVREAWETAGEYVHGEMFPGLDEREWHERWAALPLASQERLIRVTFEAFGDRHTLSTFLCAAVCENAALHDRLDRAVQALGQREGALPAEPLPGSLATAQHAAVV